MFIARPPSVCKSELSISDIVVLEMALGKTRIFRAESEFTECSVQGMVYCGHLLLMPSRLVSWNTRLYTIREKHALPAGISSFCVITVTLNEIWIICFFISKTFAESLPYIANKSLLNKMRNLFILYMCRCYLKAVDQSLCLVEGKLYY